MRSGSSSHEAVLMIRSPRAKAQMHPTAPVLSSRDVTPPSASSATPNAIPTSKWVPCSNGGQRTGEHAMQPKQHRQRPRDGHTQRRAD
eukprot:scaffold2788_cov69-Phaeocystis_antarctica.AAC.9